MTPIHDFAHYFTLFMLGATPVAILAGLAMIAWNFPPVWRMVRERNAHQGAARICALKCAFRGAYADWKRAEARGDATMANFHRTAAEKFSIELAARRV